MARQKKTPQKAILYTKDQLERIEEHIKENFGEIESCLQERDTDDIRLNFYIIPPDRKNRFYTIVTAGMGAHIMNVPDYEECVSLRRAELVICLPAGWDLESRERRHNWPFRLLTLLSRLPIRENAWLGKGHTVDYGVGFAENTKLSSVVLLNPMFSREGMVCSLGDDDCVNFYQVMPLYDSELKYKNRYNTACLMDKFGDSLSPVVDIDRKPVVPENFRNILDTVEEHSSKIRKKGLDTAEINAANHIAAYLLWMINRKLLADDIVEHFDDELAQIKSGELDIRKFIVNYLGGELTVDLFNKEGQDFSDWYYDIMPMDDVTCYAEDVDTMALKHFGRELYNCAEFDDEAYLFVPFGEDYCKAMNRYINRAYRTFKKMEADKMQKDEP